MKNQPLVSICIVVKNDQDFIEETILSVLNQTYIKIELIVIDGYSADNTVRIIEKYSDRIYYWASEEDNNIYEAINKAIKVSTGEYFTLLPCGDKYIDNNVVLDNIDYILNSNEPIDIAYGDMEIFHDENKSPIRVKPKSIKTILYDFPLFMPTCFIRTSLLKEHNFKLQYKIAADYDFIMSCYMGKKTFCYTSVNSVIFKGGGISSHYNFNLIKENFLVQKRMNYPIALILFCRNCLRWVYKKIIRLNN